MDFYIIEENTMETEKNYLRNFLHDDILELGFDENTVDIALDAFIESMETSMPQLLEAIKNNDNENIRFHAHTLKGTFANFKNETFRNIADLFKKMEEDAKNNTGSEHINETLAQIKKLSEKWLKI
jgi:HPt (histidine-containing phosphotransfer) domain-containing protein